MQLSEIAVRALSPSVNDPYTAAACIDRLTSAIASLESRQMPVAGRGDEQGNLRLVAEPIEPEAIIRGAFRTIADNAASQPMVVERLRLQLNFLLGRLSNPKIRDAIRYEIGRLPPQS